MTWLTWENSFLCSMLIIYGVAGFVAGEVIFSRFRRYLSKKRLRIADLPGACMLTATQHVTGINESVVVDAFMKTKCYNKRYQGSDPAKYYDVMQKLQLRPSLTLFNPTVADFLKDPYYKKYWKGKFIITTTSICYRHDEIHPRHAFALIDGRVCPDDDFINFVDKEKQYVLAVWDFDDRPQ